MSSLMERTQKRLDEGIAAKIKSGGKKAAIAFVDEFLMNHQENCDDEGCPGGTILRNARAKLVNALDEDELASLGISEEGRHLAENLTSLTGKGVTVIEGTNEGEKMTDREKLFFLVGLGTLNPDKQDQIIDKAFELHLVASREELLPIFIAVIAWCKEIGGLI